MPMKHITHLLKYASVAVIASFITHGCNNHISYCTKTARCFNSASEPGFVSKDQAFSLKLLYEKSRSNNLETYLELNGVKYELFSRGNGLMLGDANYNWANFSDEEKKKAIAFELLNREPKALENLVDNSAYIHILKTLPKRRKAEIISEFASSLGKNELVFILGDIDYRALWESIPNEAKKEMLLENLNSSTKKTVEEIKSLLRGLWVDYYGH